MKHLFIINPAAGKEEQNEPFIQAVHTACRAGGLDYEVVFTEGEGDARRLAQQAVDTGGEYRIYACGGDGTLNEVVQACAGQDHVAMTNMPKGTGNDFLKIFGPENRKGFSDIPALAAGPQAAMDLIDCNGHLGLGIVCAGVDARVAADVHRFKRLPLVGGKGAYILALIVNVLFKGISRPFRVDMGPHKMDGEVALVCVCNGRYYGGGFMPVGEAMPDDGILDMLLIPKVSLFTFARLVGAYGKGKYKDYPDKIMDYHGDGLTVSADEEMAAVVDGEVIRAREFTVRLSEKKVNFFYPAYLSYTLEGSKVSTQ